MGEEYRYLILIKCGNCNRISLNLSLARLFNNKFRRKSRKKNKTLQTLLCKDVDRNPHTNSSYRQTAQRNLYTTETCDGT